MFFTSVMKKKRLEAEGAKEYMEAKEDSEGIKEKKTCPHKNERAYHLMKDLASEYRVQPQDRSRMCLTKEKRF